MSENSLEIKSADSFGQGVPLVQAECRVWFEKPLRLDFVTAIHIGSVVSDIFPVPVRSESQQFSIPASSTVSLNPPDELDHIAFLSGEIALFVYRQMIAVRWICMNEDLKKTYPGFPTIFGSLTDVIERFSKIFQSPIEPSFAFVSYQNFFEVPEGESPSWFTNHQGLSMVEDFFPYESELILKSPAMVDLKIISKLATDSSGKKGIAFESESAKETNLDNWKTDIVLVHGELNRFFRSYISKEATDKWAK
jgi:uncharacterized protein (TIGR04255 family)